jgi:hypothetical protein
MRADLVSWARRGSARSRGFYDEREAEDDAHYSAGSARDSLVAIVVSTDSRGGRRGETLRRSGSGGGV